MQANTVNLSWLYGRGWTITQAAQHIGCTKAHVSQVLAGKRHSSRLIARLHQLPQRDLIMRRRDNPTR